MNSELFSENLSLTFDDVLIVPGYSEMLPDAIDVSVQLTPTINLHIPILSAAIVIHQDKLKPAENWFPKGLKDGCRTKVVYETMYTSW